VYNFEKSNGLNKFQNKFDLKRVEFELQNVLQKEKGKKEVAFGYRDIGGGIGKGKWING